MVTGFAINNAFVPDELLAIIPPIVALLLVAGSGANSSPLGFKK
jgi:hypothetical protein